MQKIKSLDRLSALPDSIIHHIFSSLDILEIIDASLLSTRFRYLWTSTPYLNLDLIRSNDMFTRLSLSEKADLKWYVNFMNRVFILRDPSSAIHKLYVYSEFSLDDDHLVTWLMGALKRNVKEIHLELHLDERFELPSYIFTSQITTFIVDDNVPSGAPEDATIHLPNTICSASSITSLKLEHVKFPEANASDGELVFSCPVLENLTIFSCDDTHLKTLTISAPKLKMLDFTKEDVYEDPFKINVCSPNLTSIVWFSWGLVDISLMNLTALVSAFIRIPAFEDTDKDFYAQILINVLRGIYNVRALSLSSSVLTEMTNSSRTLEMLPSLFHNLRDIVLKDYVADGILASTFAIAKVLKTLPLIQVFVWDRTLSVPSVGTKKGEDDGEKLPVQCVLCCLITVKIINPHGVEDELKFLEFLLERAVNLKEIIITTTQDTIQTEFCQNLLALPRSSSSVSIHCPSPC